MIFRTFNRFLGKYTLRFKVSLILGLILSLGVMGTGFIIYNFVEKIMLKQAEESLYTRVHDTVRSVKLLVDGNENKEDLAKRLNALRLELKNQKILKTGYYYILDSSGNFVLHPSKEGSNVLEGKDLDGKPIFKEILRMDEGRLNYRWLNAETNKAQDKVAVCKKIDSANWSLCASLNESEIYEPIIILRWITALSCFVLILFIAPIGYYLGGKLQDYLLNISKNLLSSAVTFSASSSLMANSSKQISDNSTLQSSAVNETMAAVEEIKAMSERNADSSDVTRTKVRDCVSTSTQGEEALKTLELSIEDIVHGNDRIQNQINITNQQLGNIVNVIKEIDTKTKIIDDIVFQTKLLSFNASVEAARAGEHGKGFSVVAEEIGNLAQMSGKAAQDISAMLAINVENVEKIIKDTQLTIGNLIVENKSLVNKGSEQAGACEKAFSELGSQIKNIEELSTTIAIASTEQTHGVEEIGKSMHHLNDILLENSRISFETSYASQDLVEKNVTLSDLAHDLAWSILGTNNKEKLDAESEKAIDDGLKAHAEWKNRLIRVFNGTSTETFVPEVVCKDDQCGLGKWIYGNAQKKFGHTQRFHYLKESHAEFHRVASTALKSAMSGKSGDIHHLISPQSEFGKASSEVIGHLVSLKFFE